ncbi:hypothetical protein JTE90_003404 [Oedothorax gibbosus]|uniref:Uncharacterized protein n=1 Tax=Oedothorax gibbosus TaxID=931172 RepID=A0AAV6TYP7_9ARAC|nr:hypothetical protein JTE90_003404 [Oedothorax gibbosus]
MGSDDVKFKKLLCNIVRWFDREGWLEDDGTLNMKCNTIVCESPLTQGKKKFWDNVVAIELNMEPDAMNDFKKLCEGSALNVRVKHCADRIVFKTPTLILPNDPLEICTDPAFKDIPKKTYPMAFFDILDFYDIKF